MLTIDRHILPRLRISRVIPLFLIYAFVAWTGETLHFYFMELWYLYGAMVYLWSYGIFKLKLPDGVIMAQKQYCDLIEHRKT